MIFRVFRFTGRTALTSICLFLSACASTSIPPNFLYETSLRGEQGFIGRGNRVEAARSLLEAGGVTDPSAAFEAALPNADVQVKRWGLKYFGSNWSRYQTVLDANIKTEDETVKCRLAMPETPVGAPTLQELRANDGAVLQRQLDGLISACLAKVK